MNTNSDKNLYTMKRLFKVCVLLSTYNGEKYIQDQIKSILNQLNIDDQIIIRDDGSTDSTIEKIKEINDCRIHIKHSNINIGFARSFMTLIASVSDTFDYYFLSDQDDIWLPNKVDRSISKLRDIPQPAMACTRLVITDENLKNLGLSPIYKIDPSFRNAVCQNIATGCTIALNGCALKILKKIPIERYETNQIKYHDWWIYLNISYFGKVVFDPHPEILYRQHQSNQIGMGVGFKRYLNMSKIVLNGNWTLIIIKQIKFFLDVHGKKINPEDAIPLGLLCKGKSSSMAFHLLTSRYINWQNWLSAVLFKFIVIHDFIRNKF